MPDPTEAQRRVAKEIAEAHCETAADYEGAGDILKLEEVIAQALAAQTPGEAVAGRLAGKLRHIPDETLVKLSHPTELIDRPVLCHVSELRAALVASPPGEAVMWRVVCGDGKKCPFTVSHTEKADAELDMADLNEDETVTCNPHRIDSLGVIDA